jgi:integrase
MKSNLTEERLAEFKNIVELAKRFSTAFFYPIFLLVKATAIKRADLMALRWKDVNFKTGKIEFKRSSELRPREFEMSNKLQEALRNLPKVSEFVFTNLEDQPLKIYIIGRELKKFQKLCGFETNWGLIDLRFSFGINFLKNGGDVKALQKIMGHRTVYNTIEIFGRYERLSSNLTGPAAVQETGLVSLS